MAPKTSVPHFTTQSRTVLSGSEKAPVAEARGIANAAHLANVEQPQAFNDAVLHHLRSAE